MKKEVETERRYKTLNVEMEIYEELENLRKRDQEELGLRELSWNNFWARVVRYLKERKQN